MKLVAGLGNPGSRYERTRHNLGFEVADALASRWGAEFAEEKSGALTARAEIRGEKILLVKPQKYMNLSGEAVGPIARWHRIEVESVLVVCDDLDLPAGRIRIRRGGGDGGHKGLSSVLKTLGTQEVPRLRIGIDRSGVLAPEDWVLARIGEDEMEPLARAVENAADAVEVWAIEGIETSMNRFNRAAMERE